MFSCQSQQEKIHELILSANEKIYVSDFEGAVEDLEACLKIDKNNPQVYFMIGNIYTTQRKYDEALEKYNTAIELNKSFAEAYANRGKVWFYLGNKDKRCEDYLKAESLGMPNLEDVTKFCK